MALIALFWRKPYSVEKGVLMLAVCALLGSLGEVLMINVR